LLNRWGRWISPSFKGFYGLQILLSKEHWLLYLGSLQVNGWWKMKDQGCIMAGYTKNKFDRRIPKILGQIEAISRDEIETRTDLTDSERARLRALLKKMESARSEEWVKRQFKTAKFSLAA